MVEELAHSAELLAVKERDMAWQKMARQIAHEIKNPLTPMKLSIQQLQRAKAIRPEEFDNYFDRMSNVLIEQIDNLSRIASSFSDFSRNSGASLKRINIAEKIESVVTLFEHNKEEVTISYLSTIKIAYVDADKDQITQVFNNILKNAIQAIPKDKEGKIEVRLDKTNKDVLIFIEDNGSGMPSEIAARLFTPNFTTKSSGMGLGLSIVKNIITECKGSICFETELGVGTKFIIQLPLSTK